MSNNKPSPRSKPQSPGISGSSPDLATRVANIEKFLKEQFDERNQWNSQLREWIGERVRIRLVGGNRDSHGYDLEGVLKWVDRYTLCINPVFDDIEIVHKGAIATIRKA